MVLSAIGRSVANIGVVQRSRPDQRGGGPLAMNLRIQNYFNALHRATGWGMLNTFGSQVRIDRLQRVLEDFRRERRLTREAALRMARQDAGVRQGLAVAATFRGGNVRVFGKGDLVEELKTVSALQAFLEANKKLLSHADRQNLERAINQAKQKAGTNPPGSGGISSGGNQRQLAGALSGASARQQPAAATNAARAAVTRAARKVTPATITKLPSGGSRSGFTPFKGTDLNIRDNVFTAAKGGKLRTVVDIKSAASNIQNAAFRAKVIAKAQRLALAAIRAGR